MLAQEVTDTMNRSQSKKGWLRIKIDLTNVFDKIELNFIETILTNFGFHPVFIKWII